MAYETLANVKSYLGIASSDTAKDALLTLILDRATQAIEDHTKRVFEATADSTRYFDAIHDIDHKSLTLYLDTDLCAITSITNGDGTTVTSGQYVVWPRNSTPWHEIRLKRQGGIVWTYDDDPEDAIVVVGRWAYSTGPNSIIKHCTTRLAAYMFRQKDNSGDLDRAMVGEFGMLLPSEMPKDIEVLLRPYVRLAT